MRGVKQNQRRKGVGFAPINQGVVQKALRVEIGVGVVLVGGDGREDVDGPWVVRGVVGLQFADHP